MPTGAVNIQGTLRVDRYLTNYSQTFITEDTTSIAEAASTMLPVENQSDKYTILNRGFFFRDDAQFRPLGGRPHQVGYGVSEDSYIADEYALEHWVDDRQRANAANGMSLEENATSLLTMKMLIKKDRQWAQKFWGPGIWSNEVEGVAATPGTNEFLQFDNDNSDPVETFDLMRDEFMLRTGLMPNVLVFGAAVKRKLRINPSIVDRIKYTQTGVANDALFAQLFEVDRIVTARGVYNAAMERGDEDVGGPSEDFQFIVDPHSALLLYIAPTGSNRPTAITTFAWTGLLPGLTNAMGGVVTRGRDGRAYSDWFHCRMAWDMRLTAQDLGMFFINAVGPTVTSPSTP